jgi:hypothetical protein
MDPEYGDAEIWPKIGDNYLSVELMLPKGGVMEKSCVTAHKRDRDGIPVGRANDKPILDTRSYIINFDDDDQTELTANMIAETLYSQCDPNGNQNVLLERIVDHQRLPVAIKLSDQKIVRADGKTYLKCSTVGSKRAAPARMPTSGLKVLWAYKYAQKRKNRNGKFKGSLPGN